MSKDHEQNIPLDNSLIRKISNWGERVFATAVSGKKGLSVEYQIPVDESTIDFGVTNLNTGNTTLVEVTEYSREQVLLDERKQRQLERMRKTGKRSVLLTGEILSNLAGNMDDESLF